MAEHQTIIGSSIKITGDFQGSGNIVIEGEIQGNISTDGDIQISETAHVHANLNCNNVSIAGEVKGDVKVKERIHIKSTASLDGNMETNTIAIEQGARVNGNLQTGSKKE